MDRGASERVKKILRSWSITSFFVQEKNFGGVTGNFKKNVGEPDKNRPSPHAAHKNRTTDQTLFS